MSGGIRRLAPVVLGVVVTLAICVGSVALAIVAFPLADYQPPDEVPRRDETAAVVARTTRRATTASVALEWTAAREVDVGDATGKVTAVFASAGTPVACGTPVIAVDGVAVLALCGDVPLWRDVTATTNGPDADVVADLLIGLGQLSEADRADGQRRAAAWEMLQGDLGQPATGVVHPSDVIWIGREFTPTRVLVNVGDRVSGDSGVLAVDASLRSATVSSSTTDASARVFVADGTTDEFPVSEAGTLEADAFGELARSTLEFPDADLPLRIQGSVRLATPISLAGIPPSALVTAPDGSQCVVLASGDTTDVEIVDSATGIVMVEADLSEGTLIRNLPPAGTTC